jgi:glycosyltransferase involved in cell wall biosynthesis
MRRLSTEDAVDRARQVLQDLPEEYAFEAVERWSRTSFTPLDPGWQPEPGDSGRPHVLYVSPSSLYSGAEECLRGLAAHLSLAGLRQTAIIGAEGVLSARLREAGCQVVTANWDFASSQAGSAGETEDAARTFADTALASIRPTCIHCNSDPGRCFTAAARELGIPLVAHIRTAAPAGMEEWLAGSSHVIAVSEFAGKRLIEAGIPAEKITVVYDGVDSARFAPGRFDRAEGRRRLALPEAAFVVLMVARPTPQKRHDLMLDAFADLCATHPGAHLVFVPDFGDARFVAAMRAKIAALGLEQQVHWLPFQEEIGAVECACDTVVLPSDGDALGTCILEAMSLQLPVVVSDSGGTHELIEDRVSGLRFAGGDRAGLAAALRGLAADPEWRRHLGRNARLRVEQRFELHHHAHQVAEVFARLSPATY